MLCELMLSEKKHKLAGVCISSKEFAQNRDLMASQHMPD